jgi:MarR family transcriptional regulator, lower aerobic nicotinate degradation pathway regulator
LFVGHTFDPPTITHASDEGDDGSGDGTGMAMLTGDGTTVGDELPARLQAMPTWLISQVETRAHRLLTERLAAAGSRGYHFRLLAALAEFGPASQASLGRRTAMNRSDVVTAVNELEAQGLVERTGDPADRRRNIITMTPAGAARLGRLDRVLAEVQDELLAPLSAAERADFSQLLTRILGHR